MNRMKYPSPDVPPVLDYPDWQEWVKTVTGGRSLHAIGAKLGHSHTTIGRWMEKPSYRAVMEIAVAFRADVVSGLAAGGFLSADDVARINLDDTLRRFPSNRLSGELHRRIVAHSEERDPLL